MEKAEIQSRVKKLKADRNAIILAHNYQLPEIYDVADFVGDSFELAVKTQQTDAELIVFCGVHFMAESAKILNPEKKVLIPDLAAGCFLADMITAESLREKKKEYPEAAVVCYVNSSAEVKAESAVCCTSANAVEICRKIPAKQIIFVPDEHLGTWVAENLPEKEITTWPGHCYVHSKVLTERVIEAQKAHPEALTIAHPECPKSVRDLADHVCGTGGMVKFVKDSEAREFLIATETGMLERLQRESSGKQFFALCGECINMKKITLPKVLDSLEKDQFEVTVPEETAKRAQKALEKMIELS
ncbi:MAG: quinolinate synthase NadA [Patescibacteria group bacterium]